MKMSNVEWIGGKASAIQQRQKASNLEHNLRSLRAAAKKGGVT